MGVLGHLMPLPAPPSPARRLCTLCGSWHQRSRTLQLRVQGTPRGTGGTLRRRALPQPAATGPAAAPCRAGLCRAAGTGAQPKPAPHDIPRHHVLPGHPARQRALSCGLLPQACGALPITYVSPMCPVHGTCTVCTPARTALNLQTHVTVCAVMCTSHPQRAARCTPPAAAPYALDRTLHRPQHHTAPCTAPCTSHGTLHRTLHRLAPHPAPHQPQHPAPGMALSTAPCTAPAYTTLL